MHVFVSCQRPDGLTLDSLLARMPVGNSACWIVVPTSRQPNSRQPLGTVAGWQQCLLDCCVNFPTAEMEEGELLPISASTAPRGAGGLLDAMRGLQLEPCISQIQAPKNE